MVSMMPDSVVSYYDARLNVSSFYPFLCTTDIRYTGVTTGLSVTAGVMSHAYK